MKTVLALKLLPDKMSGFFISKPRPEFPSQYIPPVALIRILCVVTRIWSAQMFEVTSQYFKGGFSYHTAWTRIKILYVLDKKFKGLVRRVLECGGTRHKTLIQKARHCYPGLAC